MKVEWTNLSHEDRKHLLHFLLERAIGGTLPRGTIKEATSLFPIKACSISHLWKKWKDAHDALPNQKWDVTSGKKKQKYEVLYDRGTMVQYLLEIPTYARTSTCSIAKKLGILHTFVAQIAKNEFWK